MSWYRYLPFLLTFGVVVFLTGAFPVPVWHGADRVEAAPCVFSELEKEPVDPAATAQVYQALARLRAPASIWLETRLWMRVKLPDLAYEAEGNYVRASGNRFRMELHPHIQEADRHGATPSEGGTVLSVCDGRDLWTASRVGPEGWDNVTRLRLSAILDGPDSPVALPQLHYEFMAGPAQRGVEVCLDQLQSHLEWVRRETVGEDTRLTGRWKTWVGVAPAANQPWPEALPRFCRLTLHGKILWPARVEWWGPRTEGGPDQLLVELEFRDPIFGSKLAEEHCAGLFAFDPGSAKVVDVTSRVHAQMVERMKQVMPAKKP